jgi:hypothetical protein
MPDRADKVGALWVKTSARGDFMTGEVTVNGVTQQIVVFANQFKDAEKKPDWVIFKSRPREATS